MNDEKTMSDEKTISDEKILSEQEALKKVRNLTYITSGIFVAVGLALIIAPVQMNSVLGFLLGAIAFALGIYRLVVYFRHQRLETVIATDLFFGVLLSMVGFFCLIYHSQVLTYVTLIFGACLIFGGAVKIQNAMILQRMGHMVWWLPLIGGMVSFIFAVLVTLNPAFIANIFLSLAGVFILYDGLSSLGSVVMWEVFQKQLSKGKTTGWGHPPVPGEEPETKEPKASAAAYAAGAAAMAAGPHRSAQEAAAASGAADGMDASHAPEEKKKFSFFGLFKKKEAEEGASFDAGSRVPDDVETLSSGIAHSGPAVNADTVYEKLDEQPLKTPGEGPAFAADGALEAGVAPDLSLKGAADEPAQGEGAPDEPAESGSAPAGYTAGEPSAEQPAPGGTASGEAASADPGPFSDPLPELKPDPVKPGEELPPMHFDPETGKKLD